LSVALYRAYDTQTRLFAPATLILILDPMTLILKIYQHTENELYISRVNK